MSSDDRINSYILDTQIEIFDDAKAELQLTLDKIADASGIPVTTLKAYANGVNKLTLPAIKRLLKVKRGIMAPLLSRLFDPEDFELSHPNPAFDADDIAARCAAFMAEYARNRAGQRNEQHLAEMGARLRLCLSDDALNPEPTSFIGWLGRALSPKREG